MVTSIFHNIVVFVGINNFSSEILLTYHIINNIIGTIH